MNAHFASHAGVRTSVRAPAVRFGRIGLAVMLLSIAVSAARASDRDSTHVLPWGAQLWGEGGVGGLVAPKDVRRSFQVGFGGSTLFRIEHGPRYSSHLRLEVQAVPRSDQIQVIDQFGNLSNISLGGNGMRYSAIVGAGVRTWHRLWLEGGVGVAHFNVRTGSDLIGDLDEPPSITAVRNTTGIAAEGQLVWRFPITDTQSMSVNLGWEGNRAGQSGRWLYYLPFRIGYRFL